MEQVVSFPFELFQRILFFADFLTQIRLRLLNKKFYAELEIHDFCNIDDKYLRLLDDRILRLYTHIKYLNLNNNRYVTDINHLTKLEILHAENIQEMKFFDAGIEKIREDSLNDAGIKNINVKELHVSNSVGITNVSHMNKLVVLDASGRCGINNNGIQNLTNLRDLRANNNGKITSVSHLTNLSILDVSGSTIDNNGIQNLDLAVLNIENNSHITNINHMTNLKMLCAGGVSGINTKGIFHLCNLEELYVDNNAKITSVNHMSRLEKLVATGNQCGIGDKGISHINLRTLLASCNKKITNVNHMDKLKILDARWDCGIDDVGIADLKLELLKSDFNPKISERAETFRSYMYETNH